MLARVGCAAVAFLVLATAAGAVSGREYVLWTGSKVYVTADGHSWRQVTPSGAVRPGTFRAIDAVAFRGAREGWLIASDCSNGRGSVYRSSDGGRSWKAYAFHAHPYVASLETSRPARTRASTARPTAADRGGSFPSSRRTGGRLRSSVRETVGSPGSACCGRSTAAGAGRFSRFLLRMATAGGSSCSPLPASSAGRAFLQASLGAASR